MSKKFLFLSVGALLIITVHCAAKKSKKKAKKKAKSSLLWRISGKNLKKASYLFGTIHLICKEDFFWTPVMKKALKFSKQVAFELDLSNPELDAKVSQGMMLPPDKSLKDYFTEPQYKGLIQYAQDSLGLPPMALDRMKPFAVLSIAMTQSIQCDNTESYESTIMGWAKEDEKKIIGLETVEDQLAIIEEMNPVSSAQQLIRLMNHPQKAEQQYEQLLSAYLNQDIAKMAKLIRESPDIKSDLNTLLINRNKKWIPEIINLIHQKPTFIAVGAGHLGGDDGVIQLLKQAGYKVDPVR